MRNLHVYVGCEPFPKKKKGDYYTVAPGQYPFNPEFSFDAPDMYTYVQNYTVTIDDVDASGGLFVIVHAEICDILCNTADEICTTEQLGQILSEEFEGEGEAFSATGMLDCYDDKNDKDLDGIEDLCDICPTDSNNLCNQIPNLSSTSEVQFRTYPVPFDNELNVIYNFEYDTNVNIEIFDIRGVRIQNVIDNNYVNGTQGKATLDMSNIDNQMYFVRVSTNKGALVKKVISSSLKKLN